MDTVRSLRSDRKEDGGQIGSVDTGREEWGGGGEGRTGGRTERASERDHWQIQNLFRGRG